MVEGYQPNTFRDPGMTMGRMDEMAETGLAAFTAMGGGLNEFLVRMNPERALANLPSQVTGGAPISKKDIAAIKKAGLFGELPSAFAKGSALNTAKSRAAVMGAGATKIAGMKRIPLAYGAYQVLSGDPAGGVGTATGGLIGQALLRTAPAPVRLAGMVFGGMLGGSAARNISGMNPNDPLSGPDISIPGIDYPLTPYARTKQRAERMREMKKEDMEMAQEFSRKQMAMQLANQLIANQQQISGDLAAQMIRSSPFGR